MPEKNKVAKTPDKKAAAKKSEKKSKFHPVKTFKEMWSELKKVTWPTKKELINYSLVVFAFMLIMTVIIGVFDFAASALVNLIVSL